VALSSSTSKHLSSSEVQSTVGKKKDKGKDKEKLKDDGRPGRKELAREVERLQAQNEALLARLERIAEIANADPDVDIEPSRAVLEPQEA
jgi:hypothetical protein